MKLTIIDPLHMVAVRAVQRDLQLAQVSHERFFKELFRRYELDETKKYFFADDGKVSELETIEEVRAGVQREWDKVGPNGDH